MITENVEGHICQLIVNEDGSFDYKFDNEVVWHTRTDAKKVADKLGDYKCLFDAFFIDYLQHWNLDQFAKEIFQ